MNIFNLSTPAGKDPHHVLVTMDQADQDELWEIIERHAADYSYGTKCSYCHRDFKDRIAIPHSRIDLFAVDQKTGRQYDGTEIACTDCARTPNKIIERVRVYVSDREQVTLLHCQEIHTPFDLDHIEYDQRLD